MRDCDFSRVTYDLGLGVLETTDDIHMHTETVAVFA